MTKKVSELMLGEYVIGQLLQDNNMPDTPTARAIYRKMLERDDDDTQIYQKPWVELTDAEIDALWGSWMRPYAQMVSDKLKEKNT